MKLFDHNVYLEHRDLLPIQHDVQHSILGWKVMMKRRSILYNGVCSYWERGRQCEIDDDDNEVVGEHLQEVVEQGEESNEEDKEVEDAKARGGTTSPITIRPFKILWKEILIDAIQKNVFLGLFWSFKCIFQYQA